PLSCDLYPASCPQPAVARQRVGDDGPVVSGRPRHAAHFTGGPPVSRRAAGDHCGTPHLESDLGAASASPLLGHGGWADPGGAVGGGASRVSPAGTGGHGRLSREDGGSDPADLCAWRVDPTRADATADTAQPPEPLGPPDEDQVERADHGALSPRCRGYDVPGPLSARRPPQERAPGGVRRGACHFHLSRTAGGSRRGARRPPTTDVCP